MATATATASDNWQPEADTGAEEDKATLREKLIGIANRLEKEATERVGKRELVERRWLEDLQQYHGKYTDQEFKAFIETKKSALFVNQTRPKTNACEARISDMLFPTDDRNWGVRPTPVPELAVESEMIMQADVRAQEALMQDPDNPDLKEQAQETSSMAAEIRKVVEEARGRARYMEEEIADHLKECKYNVQARDVIRDACRMGTGVMKGPVLGGRTRRKWDKPQAQPAPVDPQGGEGEDQQMDPNVGQGRAGWELREVEDPRPMFWRVDPWNFFPDMDATTVEECESFFERHLMNEKELRRLARQPGHVEWQDGFRKLLQEGSRETVPYYIADLRNITGAYNDTAHSKFHVWEYFGAVNVDEIRTVAEALQDASLLSDLGVDGEEVDPLLEIYVNVWFCQGEILKFGVHHLDSNDPIYSIFNLEKDEASLFGFGIPYLMRDSQKAFNAGWRMMMDNSGLSTGPQIVVDDEVIEPYDGNYELTPMKLWRKKKSAPQDSRPFEVFNIDGHQTELANIITMAKEHIDEETSISTIAQGEQGSHTTQTAHGMNILMNSVNVVFRRIVKNFDDDFTTPNIGRLYDFLMQFSPKEHIKGDYEVDARGSSVLLVREMQSANLMLFIMNFAGHPVVGRFLKQDSLPALRRLVQTMSLPSDELVKSDDEVSEDDAAAAQNPPADPAVVEMEAKKELMQLEFQGKQEIAMLERETRMMELADKHNITIEQLEARLMDAREKRESDERKMAMEAAVTARQGATGGGHF